MLFINLQHVFDVVLGADEYGRPLMNVHRLNVQDPFFTRGGNAACFLNYKSHWHAFVQKSNLNYNKPKRLVSLKNKLIQNLSFPLGDSVVLGYMKMPP